MKIGMNELVIILLIVVILFGPTQIPKLTKMFGKSIKGSKKALDLKKKMTTTKTIQTNKDEQGVMTLPGHLRELRNRIGVCLVVFIVGFFVASCFFKTVGTTINRHGNQISLRVCLYCTTGVNACAF